MLLRQARCDVLANAYDSDDMPIHISPTSCVQKDLEPGSALGHEGKREVSSFLALKSLVEHFLHRRPEILSDKLVDEVVPHRVSAGVA